MSKWEQQCSACLVVLFKLMECDFGMWIFHTMTTHATHINLCAVFLFQLLCVSCDTNKSPFISNIQRHNFTLKLPRERHVPGLLLLYIKMDNRHRESCMKLTTKRMNEWKQISHLLFECSCFMVTHSLSSRMTKRWNTTMPIGYCDVISVFEQQQANSIVLQCIKYSMGRTANENFNNNNCSSYSVIDHSNSLCRERRGFHRLVITWATNTMVFYGFTWTKLIWNIKRISVGIASTFWMDKIEHQVSLHTAENIFDQRFVHVWIWLPWWQRTSCEFIPICCYRFSHISWVYSQRSTFDT